MAITPPWPKPLPFTANLLRRLARGWTSWFGLLNEWDFRVALGELNILGLRVFLVPAKGGCGINGSTRQQA